MKQLLITGGSGQVGGALIAAAQVHGFDVIAPNRSALDLTKTDQIEAVVASQDWAAVINCAAYTAVDRAETEPELAHAINATAPAIFARATAVRNIPLLHVSTDYVFSGDKAAPYDEHDPIAPLGSYGKSKAAGEAAVRALNPHHAIIRTAWVLSAGGANFLNTMLRLGAERTQLGVVNDQVGNPTSAADIAEALLIIAKAMTAEDARQAGTWHFVNSGTASWYDLAAHIFARAASLGLKTPELKAISTADYPTPAKRPVNSQLDCAQFIHDFGLTPRRWQAAIDDILEIRLSKGLVI